MKSKILYITYYNVVKYIKSFWFLRDLPKLTICWLHSWLTLITTLVRDLQSPVYDSWVLAGLGVESHGEEAFCPFMAVGVFRCRLQGNHMWGLKYSLPLVWGMNELKWCTNHWIDSEISIGWGTPGWTCTDINLYPLSFKCYRVPCSSAFFVVHPRMTKPYLFSYHYFAKLFFSQLKKVNVKGWLLHSVTLDSTAQIKLLVLLISVKLQCIPTAVLFYLLHTFSQE